VVSRPKNLQLDDQLCFALYAATNTITRAYRPLLEQIGLTYPQYLVMLVLWQDGERAVNEIASRLALPPHAVSPLVDRLVAAGLVERRRERPDHRVVHVSLTAAGADLEHAAARAQRSVARRTRLGAPGLGALRHQLHDLVHRMDPGQSGPAAARPKALAAAQQASSRSRRPTTQGEES
jgi:DNA-binding MarR family transcriptional regulator